MLSFSESSKPQNLRKVHLGQRQARQPQGGPRVRPPGGKRLLFPGESNRRIPAFLPTEWSRAQHAWYLATSQMLAQPLEISPPDNLWTTAMPAHVLSVTPISGWFLLEGTVLAADDMSRRQIRCSLQQKYNQFLRGHVCHALRCTPGSYLMSKPLFL
ncbi:hypothetical protein MUG91_G247n22 [Manis pentadactyla]|nr:hypothetical protein MUG91_G247n22 [Manis pentadactyla]